MSALDKLLKAVEALKIMQSATDESALKSFEKINLCVFVADTICSKESKSTGDFQHFLSYSMETLLKMCDDSDSNVRMIADECLNRIIRVQMVSNVAKINVELHKEIKRNDNPRSLRAALWRFGELAHLIRPVKGKPYMQNLVPCLVRIAGRKEESVLETLATSMTKILAALGCFLSDNEVNQLLHVFMNNIHDENPVFRRTSANSILAICLHCPKSQVFIVHTINALLDCVLPVTEDQNMYTILGVLNGIRVLLPHLSSDNKQSFLRGSFGVQRKTDRQISLSVDSIIQVYEFCLHWTYHEDQNVVTSALETLNEVLSSAQLCSVLTDEQGLGRSRINCASKKSTRTLSQLSDVPTVRPDESQLLDVDEEPSTENVADWLNSELELRSASNPVLESISDFPDTASVASGDISELLMDDHPESPEPDVFPTRDTPSPPPVAQHVMVWDIGSAVDSGSAPLIYCARRLVSGFLVPECTTARVSVRALALTCLTQVLKLDPHLFFIELDKGGQKSPQGFSHICDVLCFSHHSDPQLRGLVRLLIGQLLDSQFHHGIWSESDSESPKEITMSHLVQTLVDGLTDESTVCIRHSLTGISLCVTNIIEFHDPMYSIVVLDKLMALVKNQYWLVKVKVVELMCSLPYQCVHYIRNSSKFQNLVLHSVILVFLGNEDSRVRKTTADGIVKLVQNLYFSDNSHEHVIMARAATLSSAVFSQIYQMQKGKVDPFSRATIDDNLSRLVNLLVQTLLTSSSKFLSFGCIEALCLLSGQYPPNEYPIGWQRSISDGLESGLLRYIVNLLTSSPISLDLECHQWLLSLTGNLLPKLRDDEHIKDQNNSLTSVLDTLLRHLMRVLSIFVRVMEGGAHSRESWPSPRRILRPPSPSKPSPQKIGEEEKKHVFGQFDDDPHCCQLQEIIKSAYSNYRLTLDRGASEKFLNLVTHCLKCLKQYLALRDPTYCFSLADELLHYSSLTFVLDSTSTIRVVNQLMKSLFELSSSSGRNEVESAQRLSDGLYSKILEKPLEVLNGHLGQAQTALEPTQKTSIDGDKTLSLDRTLLAARIKLFEGIVIQSLREYTTTNNVRLQVEVLTLLTQLVQLRMNYCLLDSDFVFIKFIKDQFEYLEAGQIHNAELLIPQIFKFLVQLSNEKNHSKSVITVPEIIQLCDRLMASGQNPVTHCIPALLPVVEHVFLLNASNIDPKELDTQREVILAMLIRLTEYPQVIDVLYNLMKEGWRWEENWKRWYRQTIDSILPHLAEGKLLVNDIGSLHPLLSLNSSFQAPLHSVLQLLFTHQQDTQSTIQWLGLVTTMLLSVCTYKEERILLQLEEMNLYVKEEGNDPLNVITISKTVPPQRLISKLIVRVVKTAMAKLETATRTNDPQSVTGIENILASFLLCCIYLFDGRCDQLVKSIASLLNPSDMESLNSSFLFVSNRCPLLTLLWARTLALVPAVSLDFWDKLISSTSETSLNSQVLHRGALLIFSEYLAKNPSDDRSLKWLLQDHIAQVVSACQEPPVEKLLIAIYNSKVNSSILLNAVSMCISSSNPVFSHRLLQTVENIHPDYTGAVLTLIASSLADHKNIAVARLSAAFCSRTVEYMLTLDRDSVSAMLSKEKLLDILQSLKSNRKKHKRYDGLISLLKKIGEDVHQIKKWDSDDNQGINIDEIRRLKLDRNWLFTQITLKCSDLEPDGVQCARLLSKLKTSELNQIMTSDHFDKHILQHCFSLGTQLSVEMSSDDLILAPLYTSARDVLFKSMSDLCISFNESGGGSCDKSPKDLLPVARAVSVYFNSFENLLKFNITLHDLLPEEYYEVLIVLSTTCLEVASKSTRTPSFFQSLMSCSSAILSITALSSLLTLSQIQYVANKIFEIYQAVSGESIPVKEYKVEGEDSNHLVLETGVKLCSLLFWIENSEVKITTSLYKYLKAVILSLSRIQSVSWLCRTPFETWEFHSTDSAPPPIPIHLLYDADILQHTINRIRLLGWTKRHQFEELWVLLLGALDTNPDIGPAEQEIVMQVNSLAIDGITYLALSTLSVRNSNSSCCEMLHVPRDKIRPDLKCWKRLKEMNSILYWKMKTFSRNGNLNLLQIDKRPNLERNSESAYYGYGQLSVAYLSTLILSGEEETEERTQVAPTYYYQDVDVRSCVQFVMELFGHWVLPWSGVTLNLQLSIVKSTLVLSDMFREPTHFEWMLNLFLEVLDSKPDVVFREFLVVGVAKAAAVLKIWDEERCDRVITEVELALQSTLAQVRSAGIHGCLYLLQSLLHFNESGSKQGLEFGNKLIKVVCEFIHLNFTLENSEHFEDLELLIALVVYTIESFPSEINDSMSTLKTLLALARAPKNNLLYQTVIRGLDRLVLLGPIEFREHITRLALDRFSQSDPMVSLPALQILITCIYSEKDEDANESDDDKANYRMEIMEKTSALFDKIKKGYPIEVEIICEILPIVLSDFFPVLDVSTKVISEFLSPNQPHKKNMAAMVYQFFANNLKMKHFLSRTYCVENETLLNSALTEVFEQAYSEKQLPLLQDWVVHSLKNFTHNLPVVTAVWSLNCFFISASSNQWLRSMFPHVQSRIRQCEYEDRKILCIAAAQFYSQLDQKQQEMFLKSFTETASSQKNVFSDIISCL